MLEVDGVGHGMILPDRPVPIVAFPALEGHPAVTPRGRSDFPYFMVGAALHRQPLRIIVARLDTDTDPLAQGPAGQAGNPGPVGLQGPQGDRAFPELSTKIE